MAHSERVTPHVDDARARQGAVNQPAVQVVEGQLVGEVRPLPGQLAGAAQVAGTKSAKIELRRAVNQLPAGKRQPGVPGPYLLHEAEGEIVELATGENCRMAAENALDQRRAAAGETNNKNWCGARIPGAYLRPGERLTYPVDSLDVPA